MRIKLLPGESEQIRLAFICIERPLNANCDIEYSIGSETRQEMDAFGSDIEIVPYLSNEMQHDYCHFLMANQLRRIQ